MLRIKLIIFMMSTLMVWYCLPGTPCIYGQKSTTTLVPDSERLISPADSVWLESLPLIALPDEFVTMNLPGFIDNSVQPYFRPVFSQSGPSCGQAAGIGYTFTYEIDRLRGVAANQPAHQYPTHFAFNFMNGGDGYFGVNYMHSYEILRTLGTPSVQQYGGMSIDHGELWVSGYDIYWQAMKNRLRGVRRIKVNTPEGLSTLKHWLVHHLEGAPTGGLATFNAPSPYNLQTLPAGTPEAGKKVMPLFPGSYATHAMTIVGYHDSIRWDFNGDGLYTNHLDINGDGIVDMRDWEIGGVKFVNSWGDNWGDQGFCYLMYRALVEDISNGGIWNSSVHIIDPRQTYEPLLTFKVTLKHDSREKIRVAAGISRDTSRTNPEICLYYPVFNFQGGHKYMQGGRYQEEKKTIEFGLDITPLLSYTDPGAPVRFFLEVTENDPRNEGTGQIVQFSVMDYTSGSLEIPCPITNYPLNENDVTWLSVLHTTVFDKVQIVPDELPLATPGQMYQFTVGATSGTPPYHWDLVTPYYEQQHHRPYPLIEQHQLSLTPPHYKLARQEIAFSFPFYDTTYHQLYIHRDGYILFENDIYPWPYYNDGFKLFRNIRCIAPFMFYPVKYYPGTNRNVAIWYEGNENYATIRWRKTLTHYDHQVGYADFAVTLYPDGKIDFFFKDITVTEDILWYCGVSRGNGKEYTLVGSSNSSALPGFNSYSLIPVFPPSGFRINQQGTLTGLVPATPKIHDLFVKVTDDKDINRIKRYQLTDRLAFYYQIRNSSNSNPTNGDTAFVDLTVENLSQQLVSNLQTYLSNNDILLTILDSHQSFGQILPGAAITIPAAFSMVISPQCPDAYHFLMDIFFEAPGYQTSGIIPMKVAAPLLILKNFDFADNDNHRLDPGETTLLQVKIFNAGNTTAQWVTGLLYSPDPLLTVLSNTPIPLGNLKTGESAEASYTVYADPACPVAHESKFHLLLQTAEGQETLLTIPVVVGQYPLMVVNRAKNQFSAGAIQQSLNALGIDYHYSENFSFNPELYRALLVCMGSFTTSNPLQPAEGLLLADYLDRRGRLYLEGTITWYMDPPTAVHPKFSVNSVKLTSWIPFSSLLGIPGTFTEGYSFLFTGNVPYMPCYFEPLNTAVPLMKINVGDIYYTMASYDNGYYRTIASIPEFGSLGDSTAFSSRTQLMHGILSFFGLEDFITSAKTNLSHHLTPTIIITPNPFTNQVEFHLENMSGGLVEISIWNIFGEKIYHSSAFLAEYTPYVFKFIAESSPENSTHQGSLLIYRITGNNFIKSGKLIRIH